MGGAGGGNDDIRIYRVINKFIEPYGGTVEFCRQFLRMVETAVGYKNGRGALVQQMPGRKLAHLAGPDDQDIRFGQIADDFHGEIHSRGRHADTAIGNLGAGADLFAGRDGLVENSVEQGRGGAGHSGQMIGVLHLAQDLPFPYDKRVQAAGYQQQVPHAVCPCQQIKIILFKGFARNAFNCFVEGSHAVFRFLGYQVQLGTVTGGYQHGLRKIVGFPEKPQNMFDAAAGKIEFLPYFYRGCLMVQSQYDQLHVL